jgi:glycosyltransferase involved in cell wall biosynthesis
MMQVAFVLWSGNLGGAETVTSYLVAELRARGVDARVVFVEDGDALGIRLSEQSVPWTALGFSRGRTIFRRPMTYARSVRAHGRDCAVVMAGRSLAPALRLGGYRGRVLAVEHGDMFLNPERPALVRRLREWDRALSTRAIDVEIAVSEFTLEQVRRRRHAPDVRCIPNGIPVDRFRPTRSLGVGEALQIGWAGRLVPGKGVERLLEVVHLLTGARHSVHARIAGSGPLHGALEDLSTRLGIVDQASFLGWAADMPSFWNSCDLAVVTSDGATETFGMATLEAAACGRPAVVTRNGGLAEVVSDSETGAIVPPGDAHALANAIARYARDRELLRSHGQAARDRAVRTFGIQGCAAGYVAAMESARGHGHADARSRMSGRSTETGKPSVR